MSSEAEPKRSRTTEVIEEITGLIRQGRLRAGDRLPSEGELVALLGVSRTPLREAVRALSILGVLESRQGAGTYVTDLTANSMFRSLSLVAEIGEITDPLALFETRRVLEIEVAGRAARNNSSSHVAGARAVLDRVEGILSSGVIDHGLLIDLDVEFHHELALAADNPVMTALLTSFASRTARMRLWREEQDQGVSWRTHREHVRVIEAVEEGDVHRARTAMATHLYEVERYLTALATPSADDQRSDRV